MWFLLTEGGAIKFGFVERFPIQHKLRGTSSVSFYTVKLNKKMYKYEGYNKRESVHLCGKLCVLTGSF